MEGTLRERDSEGTARFRVKQKGQETFENMKSAGSFACHRLRVPEGTLESRDSKDEQGCRPEKGM